MPKPKHVGIRSKGRIESLLWSGLEDRLKDLCQKRTAAIAEHDGEQIGAVWKNEGRWTWACESEVQDA